MGGSVNMHKPVGPRKLPHVVHEPKQHIVGLRDGGGEGVFVGYDDLRLGFDAPPRETRNEDPEKRKQSQTKILLRSILGASEAMIVSPVRGVPSPCYRRA